MVAMKLATIAVLATVAVAAPTTAVTTTTEAKPFSFSQWVEDIINPDVVALTPEQAVEAYYQSINATTSTHDGAVKVKRFSVTCYTDDANHNARADVDAAVMCINSLAALGSRVRYTIRENEPVDFCRDVPGVGIHAAVMHDTIKGDIYGTAHDFAVAGGHIMDACTWGGRTGGGTFEDFAPNMEILLWRQK